MAKSLIVIGATVTAIKPSTHYERRSSNGPVGAIAGSNLAVIALDIATAEKVESIIEPERELVAVG